jgi:Fe-S cluster assembly protein SufD
MPLAISQKTEQKLSADFKYMEGRMNGLRQSAIHDKKKQALQIFESLGIPTSRNEEWKYSPVWKFIDEEACFATLPAEEHDFSDQMSTSQLGQASITLVNGKLQQDSGIEGLTVMRLDKALENKDEVSQKFGSICLDEDEALTALNTAFFENGLYIRVGKKFDPSQEVDIIQVLEGNSNKFLHQRVLITTEANTEVRLNSIGGSGVT